MNGSLVVVLAAGFILSTGVHAVPWKNEPQFVGAKTCSQCHKDHYREWQGSMMHYGAQSPVFHAFELSVRKLTGRFGAHDTENPTLCINCHAPISAYNNEMSGLLPHESSRELMGPVGKEGVSCTFCHSVVGFKPRVDLEKGALGDGIGNAPLFFFPMDTLVGPTTESPLPEANTYHENGFNPNPKASEYLKSSQFCGSCHDVRLPQTPDSKERTGFQRVENLFTEWQSGPYNSVNNPQGKVVSCQDCHMSLYGATDPKTGKVFPPGSYPTTNIAHGFDRVRKHALHSFTAVSTSLLDWASEFPNQTSTEKDRFQFPVGQEERRSQLLRQACSLDWGKTPNEFNKHTGPLSVEIVVTNTGAGHRVPSGFSQEREMWIDFNVRTEDGKSVYRSGYLEDKPHSETGERTADQSLHDEDLSSNNLKIDAATFEATEQSAGRDFNLRPFRNLGVPQFNNAFMRKKGERDYERVHAFFLPSHMDNSRSLPMLKPVSIRYDIPLGELLKQTPDFCGTLNLEARLLFRSFPPKILRVLAIREPGLLGEPEVDRNKIVVMGTVKKQVRVCNVKTDDYQPPLDIKDQSFRFEHNEAKWVSVLNAKPLAEAQSDCEKRRCRLATVADYESLQFHTQEPSPGVNHDELWKVRWTNDPYPAEKSSAYRTFQFLGGEEPHGSDERTEPHPFLCRCPSPPTGGPR